MDRAMSVQGEVFKWVQSFEPWKQELFIRAAAAPELTEADAEQVADLMLDDGDGNVKPRQIKDEDLVQAESVDEPMVIERICDLSNVNALEPGESLSFAAKGVNVVWGHNGAGKTGYSRVLRKAGRTLYAEDVLANVYATDGGSPAATLMVKVGDRRHVLELDLDGDPPALLARIHVADSRAGEVYLSKETEVDYVPASLAGLSRLAKGLEAVKRVLRERRDAVEMPEVDPRLFGEGTEVADLLAGLGIETSEDELRELAELTATEEKRRDALRQAIAENESGQAPLMREAAERDIADAGSLESDLRVVAEAVGDAGVAAAVGRERSLAEAREAVTLAAAMVGAQPLGEIGSGPWRLLWNAAREYSAHVGQALPPAHDPAHCPLCMQALDDDARLRLQAFDEFVAGDVNSRLVGLERAQREELARLPDIAAIRDRHRASLELLGTGPGGLGLEIDGWLERAASAVDLIRGGDIAALAPLPAPPDVGSYLRTREGDAKRHQAIESGEKLDAARALLAELDGRHALAVRLDDVIKRVDGLKEVARIDAAMAKTGTQSVSLKVKSFSKELIQAGLEDALNRQLKGLELRDVEVVPRTRSIKGQAVTGLAFKSVSGVALTGVLSQGEQRRLALAMFLAEMEVRADSSPLVFDDPTSSVDQEGRRRIARTLLKLGESRQVIVFTHELSLVRDLQRLEGSACPVTVQHIRRVGKTVGHVRPDLPWEGLSAVKRLRELTDLIVTVRKEYEKNDAAAYAIHAATFCNLLRGAFERAVEDLVLAEVITRRADDVQTKRLRNVAWSEEICDLVDAGMSDTSPWVHDRPLADGGSPPGPDELQEGLDTLSALVDKTKALVNARKNAARAAKKARIGRLEVVETPPEGENVDQLKLKPVPSSVDLGDAVAVPKPVDTD
jgi:hypothetical protein